MFLLQMLVHIKDEEIICDISLLLSFHTTKRQAILETYPRKLKTVVLRKPVSQQNQRVNIYYH